MSIQNEIIRLQNAKTNIKTSIETKGVTIPANETLDNYSNYIDDIQTGGGASAASKKDVNFYDYDGTIVNSYTKSEFLALTNLPDNPTHEGLISQGWNWSFSDAQNYVTEYGKLEIGQMYVTEDGATKIYITLEEGRLSPYLGFAINGTATIDWGDGSTETVTGTSTSTIISTKHDYNKSGDYIISLSSNSEVRFIGQTSPGSTLLWDNIASMSSSSNIAYQKAVKKIMLGNFVTRIDSRAFYSCSLLSSITMPNHVTKIDELAFYDCVSLTFITIPNQIQTIGKSILSGSSLSSIAIPNNITSLPHSSFTGLRSLRSITIPSDVTEISQSALSESKALTFMKVPKQVNTIGKTAFNNCCSMAYYDFSSFTVIPVLQFSDAFSKIPSDCKIIVPNNLYEDWIAATTWSNYSSYIIKESDWNA